MENKLEQLLNSLIERGWKVFGEDKIDKVKYIEHEGRLKYVFFSETSSLCKTYSIREISSMSSGLWQFVCKNGMTKKHTDLWVRCNEKTSKTYQDSYTNQNYGYWLLESALKDESELEEFLLQNIKVEGYDF